MLLRRECILKRIKTTVTTHFRLYDKFAYAASCYFCLTIFLYIYIYIYRNTPLHDVTFSELQIYLHKCVNPKTQIHGVFNKTFSTV